MKFSTIFYGTATQIQIRRTSEKYIVIEYQDRIFALNLLKASHLCFAKVFLTEHPKLVVYRVINDEVLPSKQITDHHDVDLATYINSKFMYVEHSLKRSLDRLYQDTIHRRCLLKREMLRNRLLMAPLSPNAVSSILKNHPGYVGRVIAEVLYVLQCIPKSVQLRKVTKCFNELPVIDSSNRSYFMAPMTHILTEVAEEVDCNVATPPMYQIDGQWVAMSPQLTLQNPPDLLEVREEPVLQFIPLFGFGTAELYTREDLVQAQEAIRFGVERAAIQNLLIRRIQGKETSVNGVNLGNLFNAEELRNFAKGTLSYLWGWFTDFGMAISGCIGVIVVLRIIKSTASVLLNGYAIYKTLGCGFVIIASLWNNLTMWLINKNNESNHDVNPPIINNPQISNCPALSDNPVSTQDPHIVTIETNSIHPSAPGEPSNLNGIRNIYPSTSDVPAWLKS